MSQSSDSIPVLLASCYRSTRSVCEAKMCQIHFWQLSSRLIIVGPIPDPTQRLQRLLLWHLDLFVPLGKMLAGAREYKHCLLDNYVLYGTLRWFTSEMMLLYRLAGTDRNSLATVNMMTDARTGLMTAPADCNILRPCLTRRL